MPGCDKRTTAPVDDFVFQHGIDSPKNRNVVWTKHIEKMGRDIKVQHLVQDTGELNSLREGREEVERQLKRVDPRYKNRHGLPVHEREETGPDSPKFPSKGAYRDILTKMLIASRKASKRQGWLYSRDEQGTYSEVLADLRHVLAQAREGQGRLV